MSFLDEIPLTYLVVGAIFLGLAPFFPEPHLVEKIRWMINGTLHKPLDIFDLVMHASLPVLLIAKLARMALTGN